MEIKKLEELQVARKLNKIKKIIIIWENKVFLIKN